MLSSLLTVEKVKQRRPRTNENAATYSSNVHSLSDDKVHLYRYDETVNKKGADEVASRLLHYFQQSIPQTVTRLRLFCDSCAGQNKNWTIIQFLHYLVVHKKKNVRGNQNFIHYLWTQLQGV